MSVKVVKKVLVYCVCDGHLLFFWHLDFSFEAVGIQVPAGTIREDEDILDAAMRELTEETGRNGFSTCAIIGTDRYDISPYRLEVQERHFVYAVPTAALPDRWFGQEDHDGKQPPTRFEFFWIPLKNAHVLQAGQGSMICRLPGI